MRRAARGEAVMRDPVAPSVIHAGDLQALFDSVVAARLRLADKRHLKSAVDLQSTAARSDLLTALEAYAGALTLAGRPMPYRLRDELFLCRRISGSRPY